MWKEVEGGCERGRKRLRRRKNLISYKRESGGTGGRGGWRREVEGAVMVGFMVGKMVV